MVSVIYKGNGRKNFVCNGRGVVRNVGNGDVITDIPQEVWDKDLQFDENFSLLVEKKDVNKLEQKTKGSV